MTMTPSLSSPIAVRCAWLVLLSLVVPVLAGAQTDAGAAYKGWEVSGVTLQIVDGAPDRPTDDVLSTLEAGLVLAGRSKLLGTRHATYAPDLLQADLDRVRLFLARRGFPRATVTPRFRADRDGEKVEVRLVIDPGPAIRIDEVQIDGQIGQDAIDDFRERTGLVVGARMRDEDVESGRKRLVEELKKRGNAEAKVTRSVQATAEHAVTITYTLEPGPVFAFGEVVITGVADDLERLAHRAAGIPRGERYRPDPVSNASRRMRQLGLFRRVVVRTERQSEDSLRVKMELEASEPRTISAGVGILSDGELRARAEWEHRNLFKEGRGLGVEGLLATYEREASISYQHPALFGPDTRGYLRLGVRHEDEDSYALTAWEAEAGVSITIGNFSNLGLRVLTSDVEVIDRSDDVTFDGEEGLLSTLGATYTYDDTDDPLDPSRGWAVRVDVEGTPVEALSENQFVKEDLSVSRYHPLPFGIVAAGRARVGVAQLIRGSEVLLPSKRFYAGGSTSMRGYERRQLGPEDGEGQPIGGRALAELGAELRVPVWGRLSVAGFADFGNVWPTQDELDLGDLEAAVGPAVIVGTPIGPIRVDIGYRLPSAAPVLHILIGHPF